MWPYSTQLETSKLLEKDRPSLILKHSARCSISSVALSRLLRERPALDEMYDVYLIDVIGNRGTSNEIASLLDVKHESPQAIVVAKGEVRHSASHFGIDPHDLLTLV